MAARSVQISIDEELLARVDARKETRERGRSAVIRRALHVYLEFERRREIDRAYAEGYGGKGDEVFAELADLLEGQSWPEE